MQPLLPQCNKNLIANSSFAYENFDQARNFVWLEVNPQGQFIFLEPFTGIKFIEH